MPGPPCGATTTGASGTYTAHPLRTLNNPAAVSSVITDFFTSFSPCEKERAARPPPVRSSRRAFHRRQKLKLTFVWLVVALTFVDCVAPDAASASIVYWPAAAGAAASATGSEPVYVPTIGAAVGTDSA